MLILEYKLKGKQYQYLAIDDAIRTAQFIRNKALRRWMDSEKVNKYDLNKYCAVLAKEYPFASELGHTGIYAWGDFCPLGLLHPCCGVTASR